ESVTLIATDTNAKTGSSSAIAINVGPVSGTTTTISANPTTISADGTSTSTITVQAKDVAGNNLTTSGGTVLLGTQPGSLGAGTNDNNGTDTATVTAGTQGGTATISGTIGGNAITATATVTLTSLLGTPSGFSANATSTTQVAISWSAVSGATSYEVWRSTLN